MFEKFTFRTGFLIGLVASLIMVGSIRLVFAFPWLSFVLLMLVISYLLKAVRAPESGRQ
jgi:hypothetical protein